MGSSQSAPTDATNQLDDMYHDRPHPPYHFVPGLDDATENQVSSRLRRVQLAQASRGEMGSLVCALDTTNLNPNGPVSHIIEASGGTSAARSLEEVFSPYELYKRGISLYVQFERLARTEDINLAIDSWALCGHLMSDCQADDLRSRIFNNLGCALLARFEHLGEPADLERAIGFGKEAVLLTADGRAEKSDMLGNLGGSYAARFNHLGELKSLNEAIDCVAHAVSLTPDINPSKGKLLRNLGMSYQCRFKFLGEVTDADKAIAYMTDAILLAPNAHADKPDMLDTLGGLHQSRFERLGKLVDINEAIKCQTAAVSYTPDGHLDKPSRLSGLGTSYQSRFEWLGDLIDLDQAIKCKTEAIALSPDGHTDIPRQLNNLGISYQSRFQHLGELVDLNKAIDYGVRAVSLTPDGHANKTSMLNSLGNSYFIQFSRLGKLSAINKAIEYGLQALWLTDEMHAEKPGRLSNLGTFYLARFDHLGELPDINMAIDYGTKAALFAPHDHADKPGILANLGNSYIARFERLGQVSDINQAIDSGAQSFSLTPDAHADKPSRLSNLGIAYQSRFQRLGDLVDLDKAINCGVQAAASIPDGHANKPEMLNNLGNSYLTRFKRLGNPPDLDKAIDCGEKAVSLTPDNHPIKPSMLNNLGVAYTYRSCHISATEDIICSTSCFQRAAQSISGRPFDRFMACRSWAQLAASHTTLSPHPAYQQAMELLPQLVWLGTTLERRYGLIKEVGEFTTQAASYAISTRNYELALEWLEAGRAVVWSQIACLRTPFDELSICDPSLADKLREVSRKLDGVGLRSSVSPLGIGDKDWGKEANSHIQLALDWDALLEEARTILGFEDFLRPPRASQLLGAAKSHPIAIVNVHESRCDALIIQPDSNVISHVPLNNLSVEDILVARDQLTSVVGRRGFVRVHSSGSGSLESSLKGLWSSVVKPILDFLGYTQRLPVDQLPRLTWCPTGVLSFIPLHAAGCNDQLQLRASDLVISSYTPTLGILLAIRSMDINDCCGIVAVGQEHTPGLDSLPSVKEELAIIQAHANAISYLKLEDDEAKIDRVLDAMERFSWLHMACHGSQDILDPTGSAFHLHDGSLTLTSITWRTFHNKGLAFLSACQTAKGDQRLPEEAVHLAASVMIAGYPSVIGTMWSIADEDGPKIADKVYAELLKDGKMDHTGAARALHMAVTNLRETIGENAVARWAPFIHFGV